MRFVVDGAARATQAETGEAQIAAVIPAAARSRLEGDDSLQLHTLPLPRTSAMLLNNSRPPFDDANVRKALQLLIDTETIATAVYESAAVSAAGPFSPDDAWAPEGAEPVTVDQAEAERLLSEAGVDPSSLSFNLIAYNDRPEFGDLAAVIQDQLSQVGIKVNIKAGEYASFEPDLLAGEFDAVLLSRGYTVDLADPAGYLTSDWTCKGSYNIPHYCDEATDAAIKKATAESDIDARQAQYAEIATKLQEEAASIFLVHESVAYATDADLQGFEIHPLDYYVLTAETSLG
jgi:peptide/nickel transport system substrate-binding protein